jgi:large subunit ribosomal protein L28
VLQSRLAVVRANFDIAPLSPFNVKIYGWRFTRKLDHCVETRQVTQLFPDMKICHITGSRTVRGSVIHRRGLAKKKGGVGRHITKTVPRIFAPNLQRQRIWVPELKKFVRVRVTARGLKTINKQGAYKALKRAGAV